MNMEKKAVVLPAPMDSLLRELEQGAITNFFGAPGTGKTNLCILAALHCINQNGGTVTYLDTEGGFSFSRLAQLMPNYKLILKKINLLEPKDFKEQGELIRKLAGTDLVIVDSLSALYRLEYADSNQKERREVNANIIEANRELSKQLSVLSNLARQDGIPVIVTSHTFRSWDTGRDEVVGGDSVKYWSKAIVFLESTGRSGERRATVVKHRSMAEGKSVKFVIEHSGIKPAGFKLF